MASKGDAADETKAKAELERRRKMAKAELATKSLDEELDEMPVDKLYSLKNEPHRDWPVKMIKKALRRRRRLAIQTLDKIETEELRRRLAAADEGWWLIGCIKTVLENRLRASFSGKSEAELKQLIESSRDDLERAVVTRMVWKKKKKNKKNKHSSGPVWREPTDWWREQD